MEVQSVTVNQLVRMGEQILSAYHKQDVKRDARLLAMNLFGCDMGELILNGNNPVAEHLQESYMYVIAKRIQGVPLQYITREQEFMGLPFYVDERVLIPRQDTETLVETILELAKTESIQEIVEIGVGSGCISVSCAKMLDKVHITAMDICEGAIEVAKKNAALNEVTKQITLLQSDLFENFEGAAHSVDLVVSNPPYIPKADCNDLMPEVIEYEPRQALTDEADGLTFYRSITASAKNYLREGGILAYEIGYDQGEAVKQLLVEAGFTDVKVIQDLARKDRVVIGKNSIS